jgi:hypothetical protein
MTKAALIYFIFFVNRIYAQADTTAHFHCTPPVTTRETVYTDTIIAHHTNVYLITKIDKNNKTIAITAFCDSSLGESYSYTGLEHGMISDSYYDTAGLIIYEAVSNKGNPIECFHSFSYDIRNRVVSKEGWKQGVSVKIYFEYDAISLTKETIISDREITTITYKEQLNDRGSYIRVVRTVPRQ